MTISSQYRDVIIIHCNTSRMYKYLYYKVYETEVNTRYLVAVLKRYSGYSDSTFSSVKVPHG